MSVDRIDAGQGRQVPISRRGALGRLFSLGAGAAAVVALPQPVRAAPIVPAVVPAPDWLADVPEWFLPHLEGVARAAHRVHPDQTELALLCVKMFTNAAAEGNVLTQSKAIMDADDARRRQEFAAAASARQRERAARPRLVDDERVAVIRFARLDRNARRRAHRWIARQPVGPRYPVIRLRAGRRGLPEQADADFLDVAAPLQTDQGDQGDPATDWAQTVFADFRQAVGRSRGAMFPAIGAYRVLCSHNSTWREGGETSMLVYQDGRISV